MKRMKWIAMLLLAFPVFSFAQTQTGTLKGKVVEAETDSPVPLVGANIYWLNSKFGTTTNVNGGFEIELPEQADRLVVSYIGYQNDTIEIQEKGFVTIALQATISLDEVEVVHRQKSTQISHLKTIKVEQIGEKELLKAACCNLSESFETSPSVDVSFTDAITGTRQIQLLGLAGSYTQITQENMPSVRGLAAIYGLTFIPGTWVESIQLNKGAGSVVNGFESIAGQINAELRKPENADRLYLNGYVNQAGRVEGNAHAAHKLSDKFSTAVLLHAKNNSIKNDHNHDGFLDNPLGTNFIGINRWKYIGPKGFRTQAGIKFTQSDSRGGQTDFDPADDAMTTNHWGLKLDIQRLEGWVKGGKAFEATPWKSIGLQFFGATHKQDSYFGLNDYDATQRTFYGNFIFQSIFANTRHKYKLGTSFQYDDYDEQLNARSFDRSESVPGVFFEYTYTPSDKLGIVAGIRADHHNVYGTFVTPRLHFRYALSDQTVLRASAGKGQRTANVISENSGLLATARELIILGDDSDKPYGLDQEVAWNYGVNLTQDFRLDYRDGAISFDFYRTDFVNQIVVDLDQSPQQAVFYNLDGRSYSNSFQVQLDYELIRHLDARLAYRWFDVKTTYDGELMQKPLVSAHRAFLNLAYETNKHWKFDYTVSWQGSKRIPFTDSNPAAYQLEERSPDFVLMNAQLSKLFGKQFEVYVGVENILDYHQHHPILSSEKPFSPYFDSSLVWGPIFGRNTYLGFRYKIN